MKLHNLSDVSTDKLKRLSMVNVSVVVGGKYIAPGKSETFRFMPASAQRYVTLGVLSPGDEPPQEYLAAKAPAPEPAKATPAVEEAAPAPELPMETAATDPAPMPTRSSRRYRSEE